MNDESIALKCSGVVQRFKDLTVLDHVDLEIPTGSVTALLGPNGAGKTTLIDIALGLVPPKAGEVSVFGLPPRQAVATGRVAASLQTVRFPDGFTVKSALKAIACTWDDPCETNMLLEMLNLKHLENRKLRKLSGGEQQRLRTAIALLSNPDFLFLDEPTTGMDVNSRQAFWEIMQGYARQGRSILFATHYLAEAQDFSDSIVILNRGKVVAQGTPSQIKQHAKSRLRVEIPDQFNEEIYQSLLQAKSAKLWEISFGTDELTISGAGLDDAARIVLAHEEAKNLTIEPASLDEAFSTITTR